MISTGTEAPDRNNLFLEQQVVRLQALLEAARQVHSTMDFREVLQGAARIIVLELEMEGALFTDPMVSFGHIPEVAGCASAPVCFPLRTREGVHLSDLLVFSPGGRALTLYETDFLEGLLLQTALAADNAANHQRHLEYVRISRDLDAARLIQRSLLPQTLPELPGYSLATRSVACYEVGGDYLDVVEEPGGSYLMVVADVAGKGLASALICTGFRSVFRALARELLPLPELAARLSEQHWEEGPEARRRYVTAIFLRLHPELGRIEVVNAGHNPACLLKAGDPGEPQLISASGTPLGMLPGASYVAEHLVFPPGARILLYTDGLTEVFQEEEEFGFDRLAKAFATITEHCKAGAGHCLDGLWDELDRFTSGAHQQDDMSAIALLHLYPCEQESS